MDQQVTAWGAVKAGCALLAQSWRLFLPLTIISFVLSYALDFSWSLLVNFLEWEPWGQLLFPLASAPLAIFLNSPILVSALRHSYSADYSIDRRFLSRLFEHREVNFFKHLSFFAIIIRSIGFILGITIAMLAYGYLEHLMLLDEYGVAIEYAIYTLPLAASALVSYPFLGMFLRATSGACNLTTQEEKILYLNTSTKICLYKTSLIYIFISCSLICVALYNLYEIPYGWQLCIQDLAIRATYHLSMIASAFSSGYILKVAINTASSQA